MFKLKFCECAWTLLQLLVTKELYKAEILVVARIFVRHSGRLAYESMLVCKEKFIGLKLTLFSWYDFKSSAYVLLSNSLACVRAGAAHIAAASTIKLPR